MAISLKNFILHQLAELESMHQYDVATDTVRAWIDLWVDGQSVANLNKEIQTCSSVSATEDEAKKLGWIFVKKYFHDQYYSCRYMLGKAIIEFTYEDEKLITCDFNIDEYESSLITLKKLKSLTDLINDLD